MIPEISDITNTIAETITLITDCARPVCLPSDTMSKLIFIFCDYLQLPFLVCRQEMYQHTSPQM